MKNTWNLGECRVFVGALMSTGRPPMFRHHLSSSSLQFSSQTKSKGYETKDMRGDHTLLLQPLNLKLQNPINKI